MGELNSRDAKFHGGPLSGQVSELPPHAVDRGWWELHYNGHHGRYVRDERSDRGRDWDWEEA